MGWEDLHCLDKHIVGISCITISKTLLLKTLYAACLPPTKLFLVGCDKLIFKFNKEKDFTIIQTA